MGHRHFEVLCSFIFVHIVKVCFVFMLIFFLYIHNTLPTLGNEK